MESQDSNNFRKEILAQRFAREHTDMDIYEREIYNMFVRKTVGYGQYMSDFISYDTVAVYTKLSLSTIKRVIPKLIAKGYILKVATNQVAHVGKLPYKYLLNMKLNGFPSLGTLAKNREDKEETSNNHIDDLDDNSRYRKGGVLDRKLFPKIPSLDNNDGFGEYTNEFDKRLEIKIRGVETPEFLKFKARFESGALDEVIKVKTEKRAELLALQKEETAAQQ